jgi:hypothetical protein
MRMLAIIVLVFAVLVFDISHNDGRLLACVESYAQTVMREVGV